MIRNLQAKKKITKSSGKVAKTTTLLDTLMSRPASHGTDHTPCLHSNSNSFRS